MEGDPAAVLEPPGLRLADVVQQGGQPVGQVGTVPQGRLQLDRLLENGERVLVHVLVAPVLVVGALQQRAVRAGSGRRVRWPPAATARVADRAARSSLENSSRIRSAEMISSRAAIAVIAASVSRLHVETQLRGEPAGTQHPQRIVPERDLRLGRRAQDAGGEVGHSAERVDELRSGRAAAAGPSR